MSKVYEEVISNILVELDKNYSEYKRLHKELYDRDDRNAEYIYGKMVNLCIRIREEIIAKINKEGK